MSQRLSAAYTYYERQYHDDSFYLCCLSCTSAAVKQGHTGHLPLLDSWARRWRGTGDVAVSRSENVDNESYALRLMRSASQAVPATQQALQGSARIGIEHN
jgi:hypothetical protein